MAKKKKGRKGKVAAKKAIDRCRHSDAVQFTGSSAQWCPGCGSARYAEGGAAPRWRKARVSDKRAGRKPSKTARAASKSRVASKSQVASKSRAAPKLRAASAKVRRGLDVVTQDSAAIQ